MATPQFPKPPHHPTIEIPAGLNAAYANLVRISHSPTELVFDFAYLLPGASTAQVRAQVVMSPLGAKLLYRALAENLQRFETTFGEIKIPGEASLADFLFRPPNPPDPHQGKSEPDHPPTP